jgi:chromosome segregation ATPase
MKQILKRLELIKTSIEIEDEEIIELQVSKIQSLNIDSDVENILNMIENSDYGNVVVAIESYIKKYTGVVIFEDKELQGLKLELKILEKKVQELSEKNSEYVNSIAEFNTQYNLYLGDLIEKILFLRKNIIYKESIKKNSEYQKRKERAKELKEEFETIEEEFEEKKDELETLKEKIEKLEKEYEEASFLERLKISKKLKEAKEEYENLKESYDESEKEYEDLKREFEDNKEDFEQFEKEFEEKLEDEEYDEAKSDYEEFYETYEEQLKNRPCELDEAQKNELKKLYRKASKICHPDIVSDEFKEQAHEMQLELNEAYAKKDLAKVKEILYKLENGQVFEVASDSIDDKELLKSKIADLKDRIDELSKSIENLKESDNMKTIEDIDNLDEYFEDMKSKLEDEYERLKEREEELESGE